MKVLHFGTLDVTAGGPAMSTYLTLKGLRSFGVDAQVAMFPLSPNGRLRGEDVPVHYVSAPKEQKFCYSRKLKTELVKLGAYDIYHAQGIWQWHTYKLVDVARQLHKPYLITPRGMLYPQDIAKSSTMFKKLSLWWRLRNDFNKAACVHVTCDEEMHHCRNLGITSPIAIIPNPIAIRDYEYKKCDDVFRLGYLGRLSPRKNVEALIYAFAELGERAHDAELLIIGGGDEKYEHFLKSEVARLQLRNVRFAGFLSGEEKDQAIASLSVLAMPSEFENFGNVIIEGLLRRIPCIATKGSPWQELETHQCGWWVDYSQTAITAAVDAAMRMHDDQLRTMGDNGRLLVEKKYSVESVGRSMAQLYQWILGEVGTPDFVYVS